MNLIQKGDLSADAFTNDNTLNAGGIDVRVDAGSTVGDAVDAKISDALESPAFEAAVKDFETPVELSLDTDGNYNLKNEAGTETVIEPGNFLSSDAGQSLSTDALGKLFVNVIGMLPDGTTFSGSNNGDVDITLVPDITDPNLVTIEANLDYASQTPTSGTNMLKLGGSGYYVSGREMANEIAGDSTALAALVAAVPSASETVQGKVELATSAEVITGTDTTRAVTPAGLNARTATETRAGLVELATNAETITGTSTSLAVTPAGLSSAVGTLVPAASETIAGKAEIATQTEVDAGTDDTRFVTPLKLAAAVPVAADTVQGKVALNLGSALPGDATNTTDALTATGFNTIANSTATTGGNAIQKAVVNAVEQAIGADQGAQTAIADAIKEEVAAAIAADPASAAAIAAVVPVATDTTQGKVALNLGNDLPDDAENCTDALTACGLVAMINDPSEPPNAIVEALNVRFQSAPLQPQFDWDTSTLSPSSFSTSPTILAAHTGMRRCVLNANGTVNYYLSASNSALKVDGTSADLTGADGNVMVEIPKFYVRFTTNGTVQQWFVSDAPAADYDVHPAFVRNGAEVDHRYYSAYEAAVFDASAGTVIDGLNLDAQGTRVDTANDRLVSVSGKFPMAGLTRAQFRTLAAKNGAGWSIGDFWLWQAIQLLYLVEFQTVNSQAVLGAGNTALTYPASSANQADSPHSIAGKSNSLGNGSTNSVTGASSVTRNTAFMSYRGIENFFGNCWNWTDGFNVNNLQVFVSNSTTSFADDTATGYTSVGAALPTAAASFIRSFQSIGPALLPASVTGASSTTGITDGLWTDAGWRVAAVGGDASVGALAGAFDLTVSNASGILGRNVGARVAF